MIPRDLLAGFFKNPRLVAHFEKMDERVEKTETAVAAAVEATDRMDEATVLTLSPNKGFVNERVLILGRGLKADIAKDSFTLSVAYSIPAAAGGFPITFIADGETQVALPLSGRLSTVGGVETLTNKTMNAPKMSGLVNAADDAAAAAGGVPVGGVYRNGSALMVRVA